MISILMGLYNGVEYLEESIDSVLSQKYGEWELLIGVNGHEKNSEVFKIAIAKSLEDERIIVCDLDTKGKPATLNYLVENVAKYEYVAILDVDDVWHPRKLEEQVKYLSEYDVVGTNCEYFGSMSGSPRLLYGEITLTDLLDFNTLINSSAIVKKSLAFWKEEMDGVEDYELWLRLARQGILIYNLEDKLCKHRVHPKSHFNTRDFSKQIERIKKDI